MGVMMEWPRALKGGWGLEEVLVCDPTPCNGVNSQHPPLRIQFFSSIDTSIYNACIYDIDDDVLDIDVGNQGLFDHV